METLIEHYLLRYNYCPLPSVGSLELMETPASIRLGENIITAPSPKISFVAKERTAEDFISYIASKKGIEHTQASEILIDYCNGINNLDQRQEKRIYHTGTFFIDNDGSLSFKQFVLPEEFLPSVSMHRVIHPNSVHQIRVGDKEHTSEFMSDYFKSISKIKRSTWWIWAIALAAVAIAACIYYYSANSFINGFGNGNSVNPSTQVKTYKAIN